MGGLWSSMSIIAPIWRQTFPPKPIFSTEQIPDLTGRVVVVTGGNAGIGKETIRVLLGHNAKVYMASRSQEKADAAIQELKRDTGREALFLYLDLSSLQSVRNAAEELLSKEPQLHLLFNNAGVSGVPVEWTTTDGYDFQFGTNVIGHFLFTKLLLPALFAGAKTESDGYARIITSSSVAAYLSDLHWNTFKDSPERKKMLTDILYSQSKLALSIVARELSKRYGEQGIFSVSVNPGNIKTDIQRHASPMQRKLTSFMLYPVSYGALTQLWAGTMPEPLNHNGAFLVPWARIGDKCRKELYDDEIGRQLWEWLEQEVGGK